MSILVLDVGTTSMRGILYDMTGKKLSVCQLPNHVKFEINGWVNESPSDWEDNTVDIIRSIVADRTVNAEEIEAVAITSQRSSIIPVDKNGTPLMDTIMWQDIRNKEICDRLSQNNALCFERTGARVNSVFSGSKMTWVRKEQPEIYKDVYKFVNIPEYINLIMTGEYSSDYTYASRSGLMNLAERKWDPDMLSLYEVDREKLCTLREPGQIAGYTSEEFRTRTGLKAGTPVIHCGGDQQCAAVGQGVTKAGNVSLVLGTGGFLIAACDRIPENLKNNVICNASAIAGEYVIEANVLACSAAFDWFVHQFYGMEQIDYSVTETELSKEEKVTECLVIPYLKGRGAPDWNANAKAVFADVTLATTRREMFKSLMESIFMELANHLQNFSDYVKLDKIYVSGGLTKSAALNQLLSDVLGKEIINHEDKEATAMGACLVAMTGLGHFETVDQALHTLKNLSAAKSYLPDMETHAKYEKKREKMNALYDKLK